MLQWASMQIVAFNSKFSYKTGFPFNLLHFRCVSYSHTLVILIQDLFWDILLSLILTDALCCIARPYWCSVSCAVSVRITKIVAMLLRTYILLSTAYTNNNTSHRWSGGTSFSGTIHLVTFLKVCISQSNSFCKFHKVPPTFCQFSLWVKAKL